MSESTRRTEAHLTVLRAMRAEGSMMGVPTELEALDAAIAALSAGEKAPDGVVCAATLDDAAADDALTLDTARELLRDAAQGLRYYVDGEKAEAGGGEAVECAHERSYAAPWRCSKCGHRFDGEQPAPPASGAVPSCFRFVDVTTPGFEGCLNLFFDDMPLALVYEPTAGRIRAAITGAVPEMVRAVMAEMERATRKFPTWPTDPLHASGVVQEEAGELAKAVLQAVYEPHKSTPDDVASEAIQTAAMAIRFLCSMDRYDWKPGPQHQQEPLAAAKKEGE